MGNADIIKLIDRAEMHSATGGKILIKNPCALREGEIDYIRAHKQEILDLIYRIEAEQTEAARAAIRAGTVRYLVCDDSGGGIYNGFYDGDPAFVCAVKDVISGITGEAPDLFLIDLREAVRALNPWNLYGQWTVPEQLRAYYTPYPIIDSWREEYKAACRKELAEWRYKGECEIPYAAALDMIRPVAVSLYRKGVEKELAIYRRIANAPANMIVDTADEARANEKQYNDVANEGGEGYVPRWYTAADVERAQQKVEKLSAILARLSEVTTYDR